MCWLVTCKKEPLTDWAFRHIFGGIFLINHCGGLDEMHPIVAGICVLQPQLVDPFGQFRRGGLAGVSYWEWALRFQSHMPFPVHSL